MSAVIEKFHNSKRAVKIWRRSPKKMINPKNCLPFVIWRSCLKMIGFELN